MLSLTSEKVQTIGHKVVDNYSLQFGAFQCIDIYLRRTLTALAQSNVMFVRKKKDHSSFDTEREEEMESEFWWIGDEVQEHKFVGSMFSVR